MQKNHQWQKVSTQTSLRSPRRLVCVDTFCNCLKSCVPLEMPRSNMTDQWVWIVNSNVTGDSENVVRTEYDMHSFHIVNQSSILLMYLNVPKKR